MLHRWRQNADVLEIVKSSSEAHEVSRPETTEHFNLFSLARPARLPIDTERLVFHVVPSDTDAKPQAATAEDVYLGRLLGDDACLPLWRDQDAGREPYRRGRCGKKTERDEGLMEGVLFIVKRHPVIPTLCAEDVIGDFDIRVSKTVRCLRPVADLRGVCPNIEGGEEGIGLHGNLQIVPAIRSDLHPSLHEQPGHPIADMAPLPLR